MGFGESQNFFQDPPPNTPPTNDRFEPFPEKGGCLLPFRAGVKEVHRKPYAFGEMGT